MFFMDERALLVIASAAFLGGVISIATRLGDFSRVRDIDPFAMFWTALLKPLIGVVLAIFILAVLASESINIAVVGKDPLGLENHYDKEHWGHIRVHTFYVLWVIGFLAGFSERFAWDFVQRSEGLSEGPSPVPEKKT
jgi:hypothetical protein